MPQHWYSDHEATLGDRLTAAREAAGLQADTLADRLGVSTETLESWELDQAEPRAALMARLAGMLEVTLPWLLTGEGEGPRDDSIPPALASSAIAELRELSRILGDAAQRLERLEEMLNNG